MTEANNETSRFREIECPKCKARFLFRRSRAPRFDSHGFEAYELACKSCGASLTGIIDPFDGALLLFGTCSPAPEPE
jgi:ribosomal protein S27E